MIKRENESPLQATIRMNKVIDVDGYRLFQSSFDPDEQGTVLSVSYDRPGMQLTYTGYFLLFVGFVWTLFSKKSRFGRLRKELGEMKNNAPFCLLFFLILSGISSMRGVHDGKMQGAKTVEEQKAVIDRVFADQRGLIEKYVDKDVTKVPQVFIPYKEVLDIYHAGLQVPDDVTLMWCDDNYGYIRHFPTAEECARKGGNGVYYHVSYWGRPHDHLWLSTMSPYLIFQQMKLAYDRGIQKM